LLYYKFEYAWFKGFNYKSLRVKRGTDRFDSSVHIKEVQFNSREIDRRRHWKSTEAARPILLLRV